MLKYSSIIFVFLFLFGFNKAEASHSSSTVRTYSKAIFEKQSHHSDSDEKGKIPFQEPGEGEKEFEKENEKEPEKKVHFLTFSFCSISSNNLILCPDYYVFCLIPRKTFLNFSLHPIPYFLLYRTLLL